MSPREPATYDEWGAKWVTKLKTEGFDLAKLARMIGRNYTTVGRWFKEPPRPERVAAVERGFDRLRSGQEPPAKIANRAVNELSGRSGAELYRMVENAIQTLLLVRDRLALGNQPQGIPTAAFQPRTGEAAKERKARNSG